MSDTLICPCHEGNFIEPEILQLLSAGLAHPECKETFEVQAIAQRFHLASGRWRPTPMLRYHMWRSARRYDERAFRQLPETEAQRVAPVVAHLLDNLSSWRGFNGHCSQMAISASGETAHLEALYLPFGILLYQDFFQDGNGIEALRQAQFKNGDTGAYLRYLAPVNITRHMIVAGLAKAHPWLSAVLARMVGEEPGASYPTLTFALSRATAGDGKEKNTAVPRRDKQ